MSKRFTKCASLSRNLYVEGSPVTVIAGELYYDEKTSSHVAQLKIKNISKKTISKIGVQLNITGSGGNSVKAEHLYGELNAKEAELIGGGVAIPVECEGASKISLSALSVEFEGGEAWDSLDKKWAAPSVQAKVADTYSHVEILAYSKKFGKKSTRVMTETPDFWLCTCRTINSNSECTCSECGNSREELRTVDRERLRKAGTVLLANRLSKSRSHKDWTRANKLLSDVSDPDFEESKNKINDRIRENFDKMFNRRRKAKRILIPTGISVGALGAIAALFFLLVLPWMKYSGGIEYLEAGDYYNAFDAFSDSNGFSDADDKLDDIKATLKRDARKLIDDGKYTEAYNMLRPYTDFGFYPNEYHIGYNMHMGDYRNAVISGLTNIIIPYGTTKIDSDEFGGCSTLTSVTIPSSVTSIGSHAFSGCSALTSVTVPYSVTYIGYYAFSGCYDLTVNCERIDKPSGWAYSAFSDCEEVIMGYNIYTDYTFNTNGGSAVQNITNTNKSITLPTPTKSGMAFLGWYTSPDFSGTKLSSPYRSATDVTLYAKWDYTGSSSSPYRLTAGTTKSVTYNSSHNSYGEVWFTFTAPKSAGYKITVSGSSSAYIYLYEGSSSSYKSYSSSKTHVATLTNGTAYRIKVDLSSYGSYPNFSVNISEVAFGTSSSDAITLTTSSQNVGYNSSYNSNGTMWFKFKARSTTEDIYFSSLNTYYKEFTIYRSSGSGSLTSVYSSSTTSSYKDLYPSGLTVGETYYVKLTFSRSSSYSPSASYADTSFYARLY